MLEIKNLHVNVDGREILKGLDLTLPAGEVHAIMGPNGSGKSTLAYVLAGKDDYEVTAGSVTWKGQDLLAMEPFERAAAGVFLAFQYPMEIPGVATMTFLRTAVNAVRKARGQAELSTPDFLRLVREKAKLLKIDPEMLKRPLNVGFSGGEKKRNEILQMTLLDPSLCVLDETDSGLDIDAIRIVADGVNALRESRAGHRWSSPIISGCSTTSCPTGCMCSPTGAWRAPAGPSLRSSLSSRATPNSASNAWRARVARPRVARPLGEKRMDLPVQQFQDQGRAGLSRHVRGGREGASRRRATHSCRVCGARPSRPMAGSACRIAASRPGNIPTSAPG